MNGDGKINSNFEITRENNRRKAQRILVYYQGKQHEQSFERGSLFSPQRKHTLWHWLQDPNEFRENIIKNVRLWCRGFGKRKSVSEK